LLGLAVPQQFHLCAHGLPLYVHRLVQVKSGESYCQQDFKQLTDKHPKVSHDELGKYCFAVSFMNELLRKGLGFSDPEKNVQVMVCAFCKINNIVFIHLRSTATNLSFYNVAPPLSNCLVS
jgi:hypothetical protein